MSRISSITAARSRAISFTVPPSRRTHQIRPCVTRPGLRISKSQIVPGPRRNNWTLPRDRQGLVQGPDRFAAAGHGRSPEFPFPPGTESGLDRAMVPVIFLTAALLPVTKTGS
jgi:hypothetical protein